jgi:hypothetical protein
MSNVIKFGNVILKRRGKDKPYRTAEQLKALGRVAQLTRIYCDQYPKGLPHNDLGFKYAKYMLRTLAFFETFKSRERWLDRYTPWMDADKRAAILNMSPHWYSKRSLGQHFELYDEDRERLQAWSIEAVDVDEDQRAAINQVKNRQHQERHRRKKGAVSREEYLAKVQKPKAWELLGITKSKYYRLGMHKQRETGSVRALSFIDTNYEPSLTVSALPSGWPYCTNHLVCTDQGRTLQDINTGKSAIDIPATSIATKHKEAA